MPSEGFENKVREKMAELALSPADAVWEKVEATLPPKDKSRPWFILLIFFVLMTAGLIWLWQNDVSRKKPSFDSTAIAKQPALINHPAGNGDGAVATAKEEHLLLSEKESPDSIRLSNAVTGRTIMNPSDKSSLNAGWQEGLSGDHAVKARRRNIISKTRARVRSKLEAPAPEAEEESTGFTEKTGNETAVSETSGVQKADTTAVSKTDNKKQDAQNEDRLADKAKVTLTKKQQSKKWILSLVAGAGISNTKSGLFQKSSAYAFNFQNSIGGQTSAAPPLSVAISTTPSLSLAAGFSLEKAISEKWNLETGMTYSYQSDKMGVGNSVDSPATIYLKNKSIIVGNYYRYGNEVQYKNSFHLIQIPMLVKYRPSSTLPVYAEAGPVLSYLLHTNALVYDRRSVYFTDKRIFNKAGLSFAAGAGINLAKITSLPLSLGYRFNYSVSSVTKAPFTKQHLISSMFFISVPIKK